MPNPQGFKGLTVVSFESRRAKEVESLILKYGGNPLVAPSMREIPLQDNTVALAFAKKFFNHEIDALILTTGVGTKLLIDILKTKYPLEKIKEQFQNTTLIARGPKPVAALAEIEIKPTVTIPEPNTWHEIMRILDQMPENKFRRMAIQEYGVSNQELVDALKNRGYNVITVPVYRWALPENTQPLEQAIQIIADKKADVVIFMSAQQLENSLLLAQKIDRDEFFLAGLRESFVASIGPLTSEALQRHHIQINFEPSRPKMAILMSELAQNSPAR